MDESESDNFESQNQLLKLKLLKEIKHNIILNLG